VLSRAVRLLMLLSAASLLIGCGTSSPRFTTHDRGSVTHEGAAHQLEGTASYYAEEFHGRKTANGEAFDMNEMTAAHRTLPFGTKVRVTHRVTGKSVIVRINDRGPFKDDRVIDLSLAAAKAVGLIGNGTGPVVLEVVEWGTGTK
jgi:rare lipoprotein A